MGRSAVVLEVPSVAEMEALGGRLARHCTPGCRIWVEGQLGAGKTTLIRGFLRALGFKGTVKSPTYTLVEPYLLKNQTVYHFDFYRLATPKEVESIGLRDYLDQTAICLMEWPEKAGLALGKADLQVRIRMQGQGRQVTLNPCSAAGETMVVASHGL
jgi:ATPase, YjeE family